MLLRSVHAGDMPVRSHPLAAVAAVVRRRSCLVPVGLELFMFSPGLEAQLQASMASYGGPYWDAPSAFFTFRWAVIHLARCKGLSIGADYILRDPV
jgi:hypothetical protein